MGSVTSITAEKSKRCRDNCSSERTVVQWMLPLLAVARALWPVKTAQNLAFKTNVTERAAAFWLAGDRDISLEAARALLRTEDGYEFLEALMGDCDARWWKRVQLNRAAGETRRALAEQAKKLEQLRARRDQIDLEV